MYIPTKELKNLIRINNFIKNKIREFLENKIKNASDKQYEIIRKLIKRLGL